MSLHINLPAFVKEISLPAPIYFQRRSNDWLKELRTSAFEKKLLPLFVADVPLDCFDIFRAEINKRNGTALSRLEIAKNILQQFPDQEIFIKEITNEKSVSKLVQLLAEEKKRIIFKSPFPNHLSKLHNFAYSLRNELSLISQSLIKKTIIPAPTRNLRFFVMPRMVSHLRIILPVVSLLKEKYKIQTLFGVVTEDVAELCRREGYDYFNITANSNILTMRKQAQEQQAELCRFIDKFELEDSADDFTKEEIAAMKAETQQIVEQSLLYTFRIMTGAARAFEQFCPSLYFASNPYTLEGRAVTYIAKNFNIPSASIEHGSIFPDDPIWQECLVDLVCVYGKPSKRALLTCGIKSKQIAVTGAPHLDEIYKSFQKRIIKDKEANILVATSGPGDQVSIEQHQYFIKLLYEAAALSPKIRWVVKLHTKDCEDFYKTVARDFPSARVEIITSKRAHFGKDIFDYLSTARGLITICSTSALDALLVKVPVITVMLESKDKGLKGIEFIDRGCTFQVKTAQELAYCAQLIWKGEKDELIDKNARDYINEHYSNLGTATEKVAEQILNLARLMSHERRSCYY